jgi:hypothetical protein
MNSIGGLQSGAVGKMLGLDTPARGRRGRRTGIGAALRGGANQGKLGWGAREGSS